MDADTASKPRVLVVDDESAICRIMTRTLVRQGFSAKSVSSPREVEGTLQEDSFDVILLDRSMELGDGKSLVPVIRENAPDAKLLFFTGEFVDPEERKLVDGVVQKPINGKQLALVLSDILS